MDMGPDPEVHQHHHTGSRRLDMFLALSAIAISLFTAIMALQNGHAMEKMVDQNARMVQAASWPYIGIGDQTRTETGDRVYKMMIFNNGVGPAKVQPLKIVYRGKPVASYRVLAALIAHDAGYAGSLNFGESDGVAVVPARQSVPFLMVEPPLSTPELVQAFIKARDQISISTCYCSIFDECWTVSSDVVDPKPVKQCKAASSTAR